MTSVILSSTLGVQFKRDTDIIAIIQQKTHQECQSLERGSKGGGGKENRHAQF